MSLIEPEFATLGDIWHTKLILSKFALDEGRFSHPQVKDVGGGGVQAEERLQVLVNLPSPPLPHLPPAPCSGCRDADAPRDPGS